MCMHVQQEWGKRLHNKGVCYQSRAAWRREREFPVATDGGALSPALVGHVMPWGCQAARYLR
jgi:hypothetical protein